MVKWCRQAGVNCGRARQCDMRSMGGGGERRSSAERFRQWQWWGRDNVGWSAIVQEIVRGPGPPRRWLNGSWPISLLTVWITSPASLSVQPSIVQTASSSTRRMTMPPKNQYLHLLHPNCFFSGCGNETKRNGTEGAGLIAHLDSTSCRPASPDLGTGYLPRLFQPRHAHTSRLRSAWIDGYITRL